MAIDDQTLEVVGYRVSGVAPGAPAGSKRTFDDFELRHVAIEHAHRLEAIGWRDVQLHQRGREYGIEFLDNVQWRLGATQ